MRLNDVKMLVTAALILVVPHSYAETWAAEHAWVLGSHGNYYGIAQWDDSVGIDSRWKGKRTVIYFGAYDFTVYQPAVMVAAAGMLGLSSLVLIPLSIGNRMRKRQRDELVT